jgi:hypothetical protein
VRFLRENSLSLAFGLLFLAALAGQSVAGLLERNDEARQHGERTVSYGGYLLSPDFAVAMLENWQSEYLQFFLFILATVWLVQKGSNESKELDQVGLESDERQQVGPHARPNSPSWAKVGGWRTRLYSNSLLLVMGLIFFGAWLAQSLNGWKAYNDHQRRHDEPTVSWGSYLGTSEFWERTFENWQSEFLAVGSMAAFTIYLRQRGSPESKPVGAPHEETASSG